MPVKQIHTWRSSTPEEMTDFIVKEVIRALRDIGSLPGGTAPNPGYEGIVNKIRGEVENKVAVLKGRLEERINAETAMRVQGDNALGTRVDALEVDVDALKKGGGGSGNGTPSPDLTRRVDALQNDVDAQKGKVAGLQQDVQNINLKDAEQDGKLGLLEGNVNQAKNDAAAASANAASAKTDAASAKATAEGANAKASDNERRIIALENRPNGQAAPFKGITLGEAEAALAELNAAYPTVTPKLSSYNSASLRNADKPGEAAMKSFNDAVIAARAQDGNAADIRLPETALVDLLSALNHKTAGRHQSAGGVSTVCLNDYLPVQVQVDVLLPKPKLNHAFYIYDALEAIGEKDVTITAVGQFRMSKLRGKNPEIYGTDGDFANRNRPEVKRYGAQPTMILRPENVNYDFSRAIFIVDKMFQVGFEVCGYLGNNTARFGSWFTQRILDLDPNNRADEDWAGTLSPADLSKHFVPPSDKLTGAGAKGRVALASMADGSGQKWVYEGFNTTMNNNPSGSPNDWSRHIELSNARSNMVDTSSFNSGGYKPQYAYTRWEDGNAAPSAFPQMDGSTSGTWGSWGGGWIGNIGSGGMIYQYPRASRSKQHKARFIVLDGYFRGFRSFGIEVGILSDPAGNPMPRHPFNYAKMTYEQDKADEIDKYVPHNVWLKNITVEDCYEGGIGANRYVNLVETDSFVRRTGLPGWSLEHKRIEHTQANGKAGVPQVDPGYGTSSGRSSPQIGRRIIGGRYLQCPRKGVDGHHGTETVIEDVTIDAGLWCIQWAFDEPQSDSHEDSTLRHHINTLFINRVIGRCSFQGISLHNGSFGAITHKTANAKRGNFAARTLLWALRTDVKVSNCVIASEFPYIDNYARSSTYTNCTAIRGHGFGGENPYTNKSVSCGFYLGSGNIARNGISPNLVLRDCKAYNSPQGNFGAIARIGAVAVFRMDGLFADMTAYAKASTLVANGITEDDALMLPYVGKDPALPGFSASQIASLVPAASVADKTKFAYDITSCYKYDAVSGVVTPLTTLS